MSDKNWKSYYGDKSGNVGVGTTTIYLVAYADFPSGTTYAYGTLRAKRAR